MQLANAPSKIVLPFAADAPAGDINVIPVASQIPINAGAASYTDGFPPATFLDPIEGGIGPSGADFNGILNAVSALGRWYNSGSSFPYDSTFSTAVGGYPKGARVLQASGLGHWLSIVDNNTTDPDTGGAGWIPQGSKILSSVFASAQQTLAMGNSKVLFDTVEFDSGFWNAANKRYVALYAGLYQLSGSVLLATPGGQVLACQIFRNGAISKHCFETSQVSDQDLTLPFHAVIDLAVGDFLEVFVSSTQTAVLAGVAGSNSAFVYAQLQYLGQ